MLTKHDRSAVVIGGGVVGTACALRLQLAGLQCQLIDPLTGPRSASYGNAGHVATEQVAPLASWSTIRSAPRRLFAFGGPMDVRDPLSVAPWLCDFVRAAGRTRFDAGKTALRAFMARTTADWSDLLGMIGRKDLLREDGHLVVWESAASAARGRDYWMTADIGNTRVRDLRQDDLESVDRTLWKRIAAGLRFEGSGQIVEIDALLAEMRKSFVAADGKILCGTAEALEHEGDDAAVVLDDGSRVRGDCILVASGVKSGALMATLGVRAPLIAERGYHLHWSAHDWPEHSPPVVFEDRSIILTRFRNGLRLAGFVEFARDGVAPDPRKWQRLHAHAHQLRLPAHGQAVEWMGARPTLPDYLPAIGRSTRARNLLYAFGHQHLGLTLAATTADAVTALATGRPCRVSIDAFDLARFDSSAGAGKH